MTRPDTHGVRDMEWEELEILALGQGPDLGKTANAKAEIRRRERAEDVAYDEVLAKREVQSKKFYAAQFEKLIEAANQLVDQQSKSASKFAISQLRIARTMMWATIALALATFMLFIASWIKG